MMTKQQGSKPEPPGAIGGRPARLDRDVQLKIGEGLRAMYRDVLEQGVPDRFVDLLAEFDQRGGTESQRGGTEKDSRQK